MGREITWKLQFGEIIKLLDSCWISDNGWIVVEWKWK
jgi:hypothetical protein